MRGNPAAPDFAPTVDIHRKPGYDPCELFLDPARLWPKGRVMLRLLQKKLGFRTLFDVIPLDPTLVKGSHGRIPEETGDHPVIIAERLEIAPAPLRATDVYRALLGICLGKG